MVTAIGLPLLIVNGKFQSLSSMTVEDLETFIPFLAKCSVNRAGAQLKNGIPEWWSSTIQYKFPLKKPNGLSQIGYRRHLSSMVCRCYWYHDAQYLLPFCTEIANSPESVFMKSNADNTTSIFYVHNTIHILTFNNENKNYDMKPKTEKPYRRCLLSALPKKATTILDIYLCDNCDAEFSSYSEMLKHEKNCYEIVINDKGDGGNIGDKKKSDSFQEIEILEHIKPIADSTWKKKNFFNYLNLCPSVNNKMLKAKFSPKKNAFENHSKKFINSDFCSYKNRKVEFSSLFGRKMLEKRLRQDTVNKIQKSVLHNELYCCTSVRSNRELREPVEFKVTNKKTKKCNWVHQYCFSKKQRRSRYITLKTGLDENSRKLLKQCKDLRIVLNRLNLSS